MIKKWDIILIAALLAASFIPEGVFLLGGNSADEGRDVRRHTGRWKRI